MSSPISDIPVGSWVLVTGATGFLAGHVIRQLLERGYKVRGTVRDQAKASWLIEDHFQSYTNSGHFELATVPDLAVSGAFDEAAKGVSAIAHIASVLDFDPNPHNVIPQTVAGAKSIMETAAKDPSIKKFVFTSSIVAAVFPAGDTKVSVDRSSWNEFAVEAAWSPPPYEPTRGMLVYMASKVAAEKEVWKFVDERKPHFTTNSILPASILGEPLNKRHAVGHGNWIYHLFKETRAILDPFPTMVVANVKDIALLHVAAILDPEIKNARLQTWGNYAHFNEFLAILRELRPDRQFMDDYPETWHLTVSTDQSESVEILKKWGDQDGWRSLKSVIDEAINSPYWQTK
ncbi:hypothetical protein FSARC_10833 [Fusarium sarcochroum]|uniref:NAD-dependent epimerase/dehydratase domain-containing protein n=1 Tax=Fusarium sarcochroum TaxID=1208366 RepID=A0A8H4X2P2_9HYPO|nr:hypothetical protein FSARC_10833 [Fusarium sarcochroum]